MAMDQYQYAAWLKDPARQKEREEEAFNYGYWETAPESQAYRQALANQQQILGNSNQRLDEVRGDPIDALIQDALRKQLDTSGLESNLFAQGSDMATAAQGARQQQMDLQTAQRGGNLNDPSALAARNANLAQRQGQQQIARRDASLAAYDATGRGISSGNAYTANRNNQLNTATNMANNALSLPVMTPPRPNVNAAGRPGTAVAAGSQAATSQAAPQAGYSSTAQAPTYQDWLNSQKKKGI